MSRIYEIEELDEKTKKWDRDILDISNGLGVLVFVFALMGMFILSTLLMGFSRQADVGYILIADTIILIFPLWLTEHGGFSHRVIYV
jgi:hypothetical protein